MPLVLWIWAFFCSWQPTEASAEESVLPPVPSELPCRYGVIGVRPAVAAPDTLEIIHVKPFSPAAAAGLRRGDRLLAALPYRLRTSADLTRYIQSLAPGDSVDLLVERDGVDTTLVCRVGDVGSLYTLMREDGRAPPPPPTCPLPTSRILNRLVDSLEVRTVLNDLEGALRFELGRYGGDLRPPAVHAILASPLEAGDRAIHLARRVQSAPWSLLPAAVAPHLGFARPSPTALPTLPTAPQALLEDYLLPRLEEAAHARHRAFAALDSSQQADLLADVPALLETFATDFLLDYADSAAAERHVQTLRQAKQVERRLLLQAAVNLGHALSPQLIRRLRRLQRLPAVSGPAGFSGTLHYYRQTALGPIVVGGKGPNTYRDDAALIIDLGGDDAYFNNAGGAVLPTADRPANTIPVAVVIDLSGDDTYIANRPGSVGAGLGGIGLLLDLKGNDLYQSDRLGQGAAFAGAGMLVDLEGNDTYLAQEASQGSAFFGLGLLHDGRGHDLYGGAQFTQGFGGAGGVGLLRDTRGNDTYQAGAKTPSTYGEAGIYRGWAQGTACGFRGYASGGIGLLADGAGDDAYASGNFSQGVGYFFGIGILDDNSGDDTYRASRYAQGAAAHQAVGVLRDGGGNDAYNGTTAASQGAAWDAAVGFLLDEGGDDIYSAEHLAQGAAAMNGVGALIDRGGRDVYQGLSGQAQGSGATYWGGRGALNLGLLLDDGRQRDTYSAPDRANSTVGRFSGVGLFVDR